MAGGIVMTRRFLARVDHITRATQSVGRHSLSTRLPVSPAQDDFDQLATTINAMLERIETLVDEIRHVTHCVAHDLRTPLARVRQELEVLAEDEPRSRVKAEAVIAMLDDTLQTFASMLQIAELEAGATRQDFTPVNLRELTENLYQTYLPVVSGCG
jgi:signal transduction histidine kinase